MALLIEDFAAARLLKTGDSLLRLSPSMWSFAGIAGRLVEIRGDGASAALTAAMGMVREAQRLGETAAWIASEESSFFPPDAAERGVDLRSLVIVRAPIHMAMRAADTLARSGAFGLIAVDLFRRRSALTPEAAQIKGWLGRLLGLARRHDAAILFLTRGASLDLGALVSLRVEARRDRISRGVYRVCVSAEKDKRGAPVWRREEQCIGPAGMY